MGKYNRQCKDYPPQELLNTDFEKIFVCIANRTEFSMVEAQLIHMGISRDKIVLMRTSKEYQDAFIQLDPFRKNWIKEFSDYTRKIGLKGCTAECGVYFGETSMFINKYWPDQTLHLFDTFEGFSEKDIEYDSNNFASFKNSEFSKNPFKIDTPDSMLDIVKARMCYPENLKIHKGLFSECSKDIEDQFCFVNLDMDLYQPQLDGLRFFWNKMQLGGIILLHDYFNPKLPGVMKSVEDFEKEIGQVLPKFPIGDHCSIAIIKYN